VARVLCQAIVKEYAAGARAVEDVSLDIADGELLVLVGPSGCGKSTLLRIIAGLETPTSGTLRIGDAVVNDLSPQQRNVAMVFQDYALYPHMTVRRNLEFPLRMRRMGRTDIDAKVAHTAQLLDLSPLLERLPKQLSGGQRQRVAMGRALVREPSVSLLDEPLSNLDAKLRVQVRAEIAELQRRTGTTMIYVTHDQVEAMTLGQRVAVLDRGRLQQVAPPAELYDRPLNTFVAGFLGSPPMNLLRASVSRIAGGLALRVGEQSTGLALNGAGASVPLEGWDLGCVTTVGVRPEAVDFETAGATAAGLRATVEHVELLGHETLVHTRLAGGGEEPQRLVSRVQGTQAPAPGSVVRLRPAITGLHFFDAQGMALRPKG